MKYLNRIFWAICLISLIILGAPCGAYYDIGDSVADFSLVDAYGNTRSFSEFANRVVGISFWSYT